MFNRKEIMQQAWANYRADVAISKANGWKAMSFGQQLKDAWLAAKIAARNAARRAELAAMSADRARIENELDLAVFLPLGRSYTAHVDALKTELETL